MIRPGLLARSKYEFGARFFEPSTGACKLPRQLPLLLHRFLMIRRTKDQVVTSPCLARISRAPRGPHPDCTPPTPLPVQVMADLPPRLDRQVDLPLSPG